MTAEQLFSDHCESHTNGAESSGLGTAALVKRGAVAASSGVGSDTLRIAITMDYAAGPRAVDNGSASSGSERQSNSASSRRTPRKTDAKGDYSVFEDDMDEHEEFLQEARRGLGQSERHGRSQRMRARGEASSVSQRQGCAWKTKDNISRLCLDVNGKLEDVVCAHEDWLEVIEAMNKLKYERMAEESEKGDESVTRQAQGVARAHWCA